MTRPVIVVLALLLAGLCSSAQTAPVPVQIQSAKKVFIANGGEDSIADGIFTHRAYDRFYTDVKSWGHFELVNNPAGADLVMQIGITVFGGTAQVIKGDTVGSSIDPHLTLLIIDPKTQTVLWGYTEHVPMALLQGNRDKNLDESLARLVKHLKELTASPAAKP